MTEEQLISYIKTEGCRVRLYNRLYLPCGARGYFEPKEKGPLISLAIKTVPLKKRIEALLHEFGHYLQWRDGFMGYLDGICDSYGLWDEWLEHEIELSDLEFQFVRNSVLVMEYDAERRGYGQGKILRPEGFDETYYLQGAEAYMDSIKWTFATRTYTSEVPLRTNYVGRLLEISELLEPLTDTKIKKLTKEIIV